MSPSPYSTQVREASSDRDLKSPSPAGLRCTSPRYNGAMSLSEKSGEPLEDPRRGLAFLWGGAVLGAVLLSPAAEWLAGWLWACPFKSMSGLPCPTCGLTRAALALSRGEVVHALTTYPLQSLLWLGFVLGGTVFGLLALLRRPLPWPPEPPLWGKLLLLALVVTNWIYSIATGV